MNHLFDYQLNYDRNALVYKVELKLLYSQSWIYTTCNQIATHLLFVLRSSHPYEKPKLDSASTTSKVQVQVQVQVLDRYTYIYIYIHISIYTNNNVSVLALFHVNQLK